MYIVATQKIKQKLLAFAALGRDCIQPKCGRDKQM